MEKSHVYDVSLSIRLSYLLSFNEQLKIILNVDEKTLLNILLLHGVISLVTSYGFFLMDLFFNIFSSRVIHFSHLFCSI